VLDPTFPAGLTHELERPVPLLPHPAEPHLRALLLLMLLAREADLAVDQVDSPSARALVARGLTRGTARRHRAGPHRGRPGMCRHRWITSTD
jgi:hypothetical protein